MPRGKKGTSKTDNTAKSSQTEEKKEAQELKSVEPVAVEEKIEGDSVKVKSIYGNEREVAKPKNYDVKDINNGNQKLFLANVKIGSNTRWNYYNEYQIRQMSANPNYDLAFPDDTTFPHVEKLESFQKKSK